MCAGAGASYFAFFLAGGRKSDSSIRLTSNDSLDRRRLIASRADLVGGPLASEMLRRVLFSFVMSRDPRLPVVISLRRTGTAAVKVELPLERDDVEAIDAMEGVADAGRRCTDVLRSLGCTGSSEAGTEVITLGPEVGTDGSIFVVMDRLALLLIGASSYDT
jgi:hypothetical protein